MNIQPLNQTLATFRFTRKWKYDKQTGLFNQSKNESKYTNTYEALTHRAISSRDIDFRKEHPAFPYNYKKTLLNKNYILGKYIVSDMVCTNSPEFLSYLEFKTFILALTPYFKELSMYSNSEIPIDALKDSCYCSRNTCLKVVEVLKQLSCSYAELFTPEYHYNEFEVDKYFDSPELEYKYVSRKLKYYKTYTETFNQEQKSYFWMRLKMHHVPPIYWDSEFNSLNPFVYKLYDGAYIDQSLKFLKEIYFKWHFSRLFLINDTDFYSSYPEMAPIKRSKKRNHNSSKEEIYDMIVNKSPPRTIAIQSAIGNEKSTKIISNFLNEMLKVQNNDNSSSADIFSAFPQMMDFSVDLKDVDRTNVGKTIIETLKSFSKTSDTFETCVPMLTSLLSSVTDSASNIKESLNNFESKADKVEKSTASISTSLSEWGPKILYMIMLTCVSIHVYNHPSVIGSIVFGLLCFGAVVFIPKLKDCIIMAFSSLSSRFNFDFDAKPEMTDGAIDSIASLLSTSIAFGTGLDHGKILHTKTLDLLGKIPRATTGIQSILKLVIDGVESIFNFLFVRLTDRTSVRFFETNSKSLDDYFHSSDTLLSEYRRGHLVKNLENLALLDASLTYGRTLLTKIPSDRFNSGYLQVLRTQIKEIEKVIVDFEHSNIKLSGSRQEAVGVMLRGGPGVGKSMSMEQLTAACAAQVYDAAKLNTFVDNPGDFVFNRMHETEFFDGYHMRKDFTLVDDFGQARDVAGASSEALEVIRMVNPFECILHMAQLHEKGRTIFMSKFVFMTTNQQSLSFQSIISKEAVIRRFDVDVVATLQVQYCSNETKDFDIWNRRIKECNDDGTPFVVKFGYDIQEFHVLKNEKLTGEVILFPELVKRIMESYARKKKWHEESKELFKETVRKFTIKEEVVPEMEQLDMEDMDEIEFLKNLETISPAQVQSVYDSLFDRRIVKLADNIDKYYGYSRMESKVSKMRRFSLAAFENDITLTHDLKIVSCILISCYGSSYYDFMNSTLVSVPVINFMYNIPQVIVDKLVTSADACYKLRDWKTFFSDFYRDPKNTAFFALRAFFNEYKYILILAGTFLAMYLSYKHGSKIVNKVTNVYDNSNFETYDITINSPEAGKKEMIEQYLKTEILSQPKQLSQAEFESFNFSSHLAKNSPRQTRDFSMLRSANPQLSDSLDPSGRDLVKSIMARNMYSLFWEVDSGSGEYLYQIKLFFVKGRTAILPNHVLNRMFEVCKNNPKLRNSLIQIRKGKEVDTHSFTLTVQELFDGTKDDTELEKFDMRMVRFPKRLPPHKDRICNFLKDSDIGSLYSVFDFCMPLETDYSSVYVGEAMLRELSLDLVSSELGNYSIPRVFEYKNFTNWGDCGAPFILLNSSIPNRKIGGFHIAGNKTGNRSYASIVTQEMLIKDYELFEKEIVEENDDIVVPQFTQMDYKNLNLIGIVSKAPSKCYKTDIRKSKLYNKIDDVLTCPSRLRDAPDQGIFVMKKSMIGYCSNKILIPEGLLKEVFKTLKRPPKLTTRIMSLREAVFGVEFDKNIRSLPPSTSAGYPMTILDVNLKKEIFSGDPIRSDKAFLQFELLVQELETSLSLSKRKLFIYTVTNKDERVKFSKYEEGSTRAFMGSPFLLIAVYRKYFGSFAMCYMQNRVVNGSAVGVNPYSSEWNQIYMNMRLMAGDWNEPKGGFGDYSKFDKKHPIQVLQLVLKLINEWYDDEYSEFREILWLEITHARVLIDNCVYEMAGGLPSGNPLTIIINDFCNHIYFLCCWGIIFGISFVSQFYTFVYLIVCGDDNAFTVHPKFSSQFNEITLFDAMNSIGMDYTTETKEKATIPLRPLEQGEFLKRNFTLDNYAGRIVAPLRLNVVLEIACWTKSGPDQDKITVDNCHTVIRELSLYPKNIFDKFAGRICDLVHKYYPNHVFPYKETLDYLQVKEETLNIQEVYC